MKNQTITIPFGPRDILVIVDMADPEDPITLKVEPLRGVPDEGYSVGLSREDALAVGEALIIAANS